MARFIKIFSATILALFMSALVWYLLVPHKVLLSVCITLGTTCYHFLMRLFVGSIINTAFENKMNYQARWFKQRRFEKKLYEALRVKKWAKNVPTYAPALFSPKERTWEEIAMATCQSEIVHETIALLSFLPLLFIIPFGDPLVFILTSVLAASLDLTFVIVQRYNRPRIIEHIERIKQREELRKK
ncbi:MAG: hypothetical protein IJV80_05745 [Clostridia bacterium]|nr:hypothetical protein [Clostridia bacterium]